MAVFLTQLVVIAAAYFASARLGLTLAFAAEQVTVVWPPTGIALSAALLFGYRIWPAITLGAFLANATTPGTPLAVAAGISIGNTIEAMLGAWLLQRAGFRVSLERFKDVLLLFVFGSLVSTAASATIGVSTLCIGGLQSWARFGELWRDWYLGDAVGALIVAPLILTIAKPVRRAGSRAEFLGMLVAAAALILTIVTGRFPVQTSSPEYLAFPLLIWGAIRFGPGGAAAVTFLTSAIMVLSTINGYGPFLEGTIYDRLVALTLFMSVFALTGGVLAASATESGNAESRYRSLVLATAQVVWSTTPEGEVVEDLPTWRAFTGQSKERAMGRGWIEQVHPEDLQHVIDVWEHSLLKGTPHEVEFRVLAADGSYRDVYGRAAPVFDTGGRVREWVGTLTDITEKKNAERKQKALQEELAEGNRRKDQFLAMLAHELRNPLAPITTAIELIRAKPGNPETVAWATDIMKRQAGNMIRLLDDLLDVARITSGKVQLQLEPVNLTTLVDRAVEAVRPTLDGNKLQVNAHFESNSLILDADPTRLEQVIINLLTNAAKFTPDGGRIDVTVKSEFNEAVVSVRDTGVGVTADLLPRIFDIFTQADQSLARSQGGLGIGLTIVETIVKLHGGKVEAFSDGPGRGSEFVVRLPVSATEERPPQSAKPPEQRSERKTVLVVEDNVDAAATLAAMIEVMGHNVHVTHDGPSGLEAVHRLSPHVVLLDIGLPRMDGYEVARKIREFDRLRSIMLVALTGYGQEQDRAKSSAAGFDLHLIKPVGLDVLQKLL
jgi:two-component system CheB/CheR fusion protein